MASTSSRLERLIKAIGDQPVPIDPQAQQIGSPSEEALDSLAPAATTTATETNTETATANATATAVGTETETSKAVTAAEAKKWWEATPVQPVRVTQSLAPSVEGASPLGFAFTPFLAVTRFPYKFVHKALLQPFATAFFDQGKIYDRVWDIYVVWSTLYPTNTPVTFVSEQQFLALIHDIQATFPHAELPILDQLREEDLVIDFDDCHSLPDLRPRWLGRSTSRAEYIALTDTLTMADRSIRSAPKIDERTLAAFQEKIEAAVEAGKNKRKAERTKKQAEHVLKRQTMAQSLLRAQRYLGLLSPDDKTDLSDIGALSISPCDTSTPCAHPCEGDVIFIAVDVEAHERAQKIVTEVGVATLDTRDLRELAPGKAAENWQKSIRARHFRVAEYKNHKNSEFVQGCPENFEFGQSEIVGKDLIFRTIANCFKPPYSGATSTTTDEKRNIILVGHDIGSDIAYLRNIGLDILNVGNIIDKLDTAEMFRVYSRDQSARSLGAVIYEFDMMAWNLHNAGNDAVYTVWALLAIAVRSATERGSAAEAQRHKEDVEKRMEAAAEQGKQRVQAEVEGWKVVYGPERPPVKGEPRLFTSGGAVLDV